MKIVWQGEKSSEIVCKRQEAALPVRTSQNAEKRPLTVRGRATGEQRLLFIRTAWQHISNDRMKHKNAVDLAAVEVADRCPDLLHAGKNGASALNYINFRTWTRALGKTPEGAVNFANTSALADRRTGTFARPRPGSDDFWFLFNNYYKKQAGLSIPISYKHAVKLLPSLNSSDIPPPLKAVQYYVKRYDNQTANIYAREGEVSFINKCGSFITRDWSKTDPMKCWFCDCRVSDIMYRIPDKTKKERWRNARPYMCAFSDAASLYFVGIRFGWMEEGQKIADSGHVLIIKTFFDAVQRYGVPRMVYSDNGADFLKAGFTTPIIYEKNGKKFSIFDELNIERHIKSKPYNGRAKTIERNFRYFSDEVDRISTVYLGNAPGKRPEISYLATNKKYIDFLEKPEETNSRIIAAVKEFNETPKPGSRITCGKSPLEVFSSRLEIPLLDSIQLAAAFLLPMPTLYKVGRGGSVAVERESYFSDVLYPYFERRIIIKKNIFDGSKVFAFDLTGAFIGICQKKQTVAAIAESPKELIFLKNELKRQASEKRTARISINDACGQLAKLQPQVIDALTPEQLRLARAGKLTLEMIARYQSVKGAQHTNEIYTLKQAGKENFALPSADCETEPENRTSRITRALEDILSGEASSNNEMNSRNFDDI